MILTPAQTEALLCGDYSFSHLGFSMMLTRLKTIYAASPSEETLEKSTAELNVFLNKFKGIMKKDYDVLLHLFREENPC